MPTPAHLLSAKAEEFLALLRSVHVEQSDTLQIELLKERVRQSQLVQVSCAPGANRTTRLFHT